ncbi:fatty-acid amide hydrolase 2-A-like [Ornithodoros turicata]|uniref:fatty-acid amide hydrolase 2-A-like n=1 Tax=Ornithodoros turicata TaxID=34597 RepID=UPI003138AD39
MAARVVEVKGSIMSALRRLVDALVDGAFRVANLRKSPRLPPIKDPLLLQPAVALAAKIGRGEVKSVDVVRAFISRMKEVDPLLNAIVDERFEEALLEARTVDSLVEATPVEDRPALVQRQPFLGVPFTTKDLVGVKGLLLDVGVPGRRGVRAEEDAGAVAALRRAGALPLALTNVSEMAMWWESYNKLHGRTRNPYDLRRIPGGSSGGEGSLLASGGSVIGVGTDIGGSIRMPAFFNGIFGHKPSPGIVSNSGHFPVIVDIQAEFLGTGPMCRYAEDLLPMMMALAGEDNAKRVLRLDQPVNLQSIRMHYIIEAGKCFMMSPVHRDVRKALTDVVEHFRQQLGIETSEARLDSLRYSFEMWNSMMTSGECPTFGEILDRCGSHIGPAKELVKWFSSMSEHTFAAIALVIGEKLNPGKSTNVARRFCQMASDLQEQLQELLGNDGVLLMPTHPEPAPYHSAPTFRAFNFAYTGVFNILRVPVTACPVRLGATTGLPVGIQVVATRHNDRLCLAVAREIEKAFGGWREPCLLEDGYAVL